MANDLIVFDTSFDKKNNLILSHLLPAVRSERKDDKEAFIYSFSQLYQIPLLRPMLNTVLTKAKQGKLIFNVTPLDSWNTYLGRCEIRNDEGPEIESSFDKHNYVIAIKSPTTDTIIHEIAHAIEVISGIDIHKEFKTAMENDIQQGRRRSTLITLNEAIYVVLYKRTNKYETSQLMKETFARFYELCGMCYEAGGWGDFQFKYQEFAGFFTETVKFTETVLNPILEKLIDKDIREAANDFIINLAPYKKLWANKKMSRFSEVKSEETKWQDSTGEIDDKYKKVLEGMDKFFEHHGLTTQQLENGTEYFVLRGKDNKLLN